MLQYALVQLLLSMSAPAFAFLAVLLKVVMAYIVMAPAFALLAVLLKVVMVGAMTI